MHEGIEAPQVMAETADHGSDKAIEIVINGRRVRVEAKELSYEQLVDLAYSGHPPSGPNVIITVTYSRGQGDKPSGTLVAGQSVRLHDGMLFNIYDTTES